jgi:hypothetical protein
VEPVTAALIVLSVVVVLLAAAGAGLLRRVRELELAVYRGVGIRFSGTQLPRAGVTVTSPGRVAVVAKLTRQCPVCAEVLRAIGESAAAGPEELEYVVVSDDPDLTRDAPAGLTVITDPAVWRAVQVPFVPALLIVDPHGVVVDSVPAGSGEVVADVVARAAKVRTDSPGSNEARSVEARKVRAS